MLQLIRFGSWVNISLSAGSGAYKGSITSLAGSFAASGFVQLSCSVLILSSAMNGIDSCRRECTSMPT
jgi:ABC-type Fe3+ transport system permease subunit